MTASIVECAMRSSPEASSEIKTAMERALGTNSRAAVAGETAEKPGSRESDGRRQTIGKAGKPAIAIEAPERFL
jgi:hypothetical protein